MFRENSIIPPTQSNDQSDYSSPYPDPSSDLEECSALWHDEVGKYVLETRQRERGIELWFDQEILVRQ